MGAIAEIEDKFNLTYQDHQDHIENKTELTKIQEEYFSDVLRIGQMDFRTIKDGVLTITDKNGSVISWASSGALGFKGSKKSTPYAAGLSAESAGKAAYDMGMRKVEVFVKGLGPGRETAIRSLATAGLEVTAINDVTPIPHNGCRPPKRPRG